MEEKEGIRHKNTFWSFFGLGKCCRTFFGRINYSANIGFTLIELLIVIGVIGVLVTSIVTVINPLGQIAKANDAKRRSALKELQRALEVYYNDNNSYPVALNWFSSEPGDDISDNGGDWIPGLAPTYVKSLPRDPQGGQGDAALNPACPTIKKRYQYRSDGQNYVLLADCSMLPNSWDDKDGFYDPVRPTWAWKACVNQGCGGPLDVL